MKQLLQEISELIQEKEGSQKDYYVRDVKGNWCHPSVIPMTETQFNEKLRGLINDYVKRLTQQAYEGA
mgnify:CR=1 FL=1